jgi:ATP-dependent DNA helicase RecG
MTYPLFHPSSVAAPPLALDARGFSDEYPDEGHLVEWKRGVSLDAIEEAAVAFSNADGGVLLLGVEDDGTVVGKALSSEVELQIHRAMGRAHGLGKYEIRSVLVGDLPVTVVSVSKAREGVAQTHDGRPLVRRGKQNVAVLGEELSLLASTRARTRYEKSETIVPITDADSERLRVVREAFGWPDDDELTDRLREQDLATDGEPSHLTVAGALYLLESPTDVVGRADIEIYRYSDPEGDYDKRQRVAGAIDHQVRAATQLLLDELGSDLVVLGTRRHELPRIPEVVLREGIANAVAHRQYQLRGVGVRIEIRPDHLLIESPGQLPEPVTVNNIRDAQSARNSSILRVLRRLHLAEDAGRGIDVMEDTMREELLEPPRFEETTHSVRVVLPLGGTVTPRERAWLREIELRGRIQPEDRLLLLQAARGTTLTNKAVRELLGVDSVDARQALQRLRDAGLVQQHGARGGTQYVLAGGLGPPAGLRLAPEELSTLVLSIAREEGHVTNELVRERTGLDRVEALRLLTALVEAGQLERYGQRRGTYYAIPTSSDELDFRQGPNDATS